MTFRVIQWRTVETCVDVAVFSMKLKCSGKSTSGVDVRMQLNVSIFSPINFTSLDIRRKKTCIRNPALGNCCQLFSDDDDDDDDDTKWIRMTVLKGTVVPWRRYALYWVPSSIMAMAKDSYLEIGSHFGIHPLEQSITLRGDKFLKKYSSSDN